MFDKYRRAACDDNLSLGLWAKYNVVVNADEVGKSQLGTLKYLGIDSASNNTSPCTPQALHAAVFQIII